MRREGGSPTPAPVTVPSSVTPLRPPPPLPIAARLPAKRREQANLAIQLSAQGKLSMKSLYKRLNAIGAGLPDAEEEIKQLMKERQELPPPAKPPKTKGGGVPAEAPTQ